MKTTPRPQSKYGGELIAKEQGIPTEPTPLVFKDREKLLDSLRGKLVDAVGIAIDEYQKLCREIRFGPIFLSSMSGRYTERYVLLVNSGGFVKSIGDLEGRIICFHKNSRNCLVPQWLDTLLVSQGYPTATRLAGRILKDTSLSQVVLPVFFRKADACVVTRRVLRYHVRTQSAIGRKALCSCGIAGNRADRAGHASRLQP